MFYVYHINYQTLSEKYEKLEIQMYHITDYMTRKFWKFKCIINGNNTLEMVIALLDTALGLYFVRYLFNWYKIHVSDISLVMQF